MICAGKKWYGSDDHRANTLSHKSNASGLEFLDLAISAGGGFFVFDIGDFLLGYGGGGFLLDGGVSSFFTMSCLLTPRYSSTSLWISTISSS